MYLPVCDDITYACHLIGCGQCVTWSQLVFYWLLLWDTVFLGQSDNAYTLMLVQMRVERMYYLLISKPSQRA